MYALYVGSIVTVGVCTCVDKYKQIETLINYTQYNNVNL